MKHKILVIEDDNAIRQGVSELLKLEGFEVEESDNGLAGLDKISSFKPNLVISDIMMPKMNGLEVLEEYYKLEGIDKSPFIFLTALSDKVNIREGMSLGADDYLTKPFSRKELLTIIQTQFNKHKVRSEYLQNQFDSIMEEKEKVIENEKVAMLKEIHHRVKNNLALISAFFDLSDDPKDLEYFETIKSRIFAIAAVHEEAYSNEMLTKVGTKNLIEKIIKINRSNNVFINEKIINFELDISKAIPFGLLFYELISNVLRHAFEGLENGLVTVKSFQDETNKRMLLIEDNGSGYEECEDNNSKTGFMLIQMLVEQLGGEMYRKSTLGVGTSYRIVY